MTEEMGVTEEAAAPQPEAPQQSNQEMNWQAAQETMAQQKQALDQLNQQNQTYQQQLNVFQNYMNQQQTQQVAQPSASPLDFISDDDVVTGSEVKKAFSSAFSEKEKQFNQRIEQQEQQLNLLRMKAEHPDYQEVVQSAIKMAETNPELAEAIRTSSNPGILAYQLGKANHVPQPSEQAVAAKRIVENAQKPGSAAQAATGGSALSQADYFMDMSPQDFEAHIAKVKRG